MNLVFVGKDDRRLIKHARMMLEGYRLSVFTMVRPGSCYKSAVIQLSMVAFIQYVISIINLLLQYIPINCPALECVCCVCKCMRVHACVCACTRMGVCVNASVCVYLMQHSQLARPLAGMPDYALFSQ